MDDQSKAMVAAGMDEERTREYRKGNWTLHETMVLIRAKKMDDERRLKREVESEGKSSSSRPTELRWKWVEDCCWRNGCMRSQNQCNDRWDNLMRDYKKVRDHERRVVDGGGSGSGSYWKLERHERKERNLPSNLLLEIYDALAEVVERRGPQRVSSVHGPVVKGLALDRPIGSVPSTAPQVVQQQSPTPQPPTAPPFLPHAQALPLLDSDGSEYSNSPSKRRKKGESSSCNNQSQELTSAISKTASLLSEAMLACEEKEAKRHREILSIEERKMKIEESKGEISMQAINGLTATINNLANSILAMVSDKNPTVPK